MKAVLALLVPELVKMGGSAWSCFIAGRCGRFPIRKLSFFPRLAGIVVRFRQSLGSLVREERGTSEGSFLMLEPFRVQNGKGTLVGWWRLVDRDGDGRL